MTTKSKRKGNGFESELVKRLKGEGWDAERAWGSNGAALGEAADVAIVAKFNGVKWKLQAKRRAKLPSYLIPTDSVDAVVAREDRGEAIVIFRFEDFIKLVGGKL